MFEKRVDLSIGLLVGGVLRPVGHGNAMGKTEQSIDGDRVIQRNPPLGRIFRATGNEEGARGHQGVQFMQVMAVGHQTQDEKGSELFSAGE